MTETAVSDAPEPKPERVAMKSDLSNAQEFYDSVFCKWSFNGVLKTPERQLTPFLMMPDPTPATIGEIKSWRTRVRAAIVRPEEIVKGLVPAIKERARVRTYEYVFGWLLVEGSHVRDHRLKGVPHSLRG